MSNSYLDKFRSTLPTSQGNQILKLLTNKRDSGEVKNITEFKNKLKELTSKILAERITPTLELYKAIVGEDISYDQYNEMLDRIEDDLETAFKEADNMDEIISAHHNIIKNVALKTLRLGINNLEAKISLYEFVNKNTHGFDDALFNTFRESLNRRTARYDAISAVAYTDQQTQKVISDDCFVDVIGERLLLGMVDTTYLPTAKAMWLSNENSIRSELDVSFPNSNINNILDGTINTYWIESILQRQIRTDGVPMEVAIYLPAFQEINFIEIDPAIEYPMLLEKIDYYDFSNTRQTLSSLEYSLDGSLKLHIKKTTTNCIVFRFRQNNYKEVQFTKKEGSSNFHKAVLNESSDSIDLPSVNEDLREVLSSEFVIQSAFNVPTKSLTQHKYYEYILGLDNIRVGFNTFNDLSVFVSEEKQCDKIGVVGLKTTEYRPVQEEGDNNISNVLHTYPSQTTTEDSNFYHGSVEYNAIIEHYAQDNKLVQIDSIPILPLGASRIYHERLIPIARTTTATRDNVAKLRFYTEDDSTDVIVYKNGIALTYSTDWEFVDSADTEVGYLTVESNGTGKPMSRAIQINSTINLVDIFTVSYTPIISNTRSIPSDDTLFTVVDMTGDNAIRMCDENLLIISNVRSGYEIIYNHVFLVIVMRRNSARHHQSPTIEDYMLMVGTNDTSKFLGDTSA